MMPPTPPFSGEGFPEPNFQSPEIAMDTSLQALSLIVRGLTELNRTISILSDPAIKSHLADGVEHLGAAFASFDELRTRLRYEE
jgi:hypothetical protein